MNKFAAHFSEKAAMAGIPAELATLFANPRIETQEAYSIEMHFIDPCQTWAAVAVYIALIQGRLK